MSTPIASDTFNRIDTGSGLGTTETGQVWSNLFGTMQIANNRARSSSSARAFSVIDAGVGGGNSTVSAACGYGANQGGYALYFRVTDSNNWWRLSVKAGYYSYPSGSHQESYSYVSSWQCHTDYYSLPDWMYQSSGDFSSTYDASGNTNNGFVYASQTCSPVYTSGYNTVQDYAIAYTWQLSLEKCVAGVVTLMAQTGRDDLGVAPTHLQVVANGNNITAFCSTTSNGSLLQRLSASDSFNQAATSHGVGYGETTDSGNSDGLDNFVISVANSAPNAPTLMFPINSVPVDRNTTMRFGLIVSDPDTNDSQSALSIRYRQGTNAWIIVNQITPNPYYDFPPGTFALGTWEWQAQTSDAALQGPLSASGFFVAADSPGVPTITAPTTGSNVAASGSVAWSIPSQTAYQVRRVADLAGAANTSTVYWDSGEIINTTARSHGLGFDVNVRWEHIQVRVKVSGLWSAWADCRVQVSWTAPMVPTLACFPDTSSGSIRVVITNPAVTGGAPATSYNDIYISSVSEAEYRAATFVAPNSTYTYKIPTSDKVYFFRVVAVGSNQSTASSLPDETVVDGGTPNNDPITVISDGGAP